MTADYYYAWDIIYRDLSDAAEWEEKRKHNEFIESLNTPEKIEELKNTINKYKNNNSYIWNENINEYLKNISFYDFAQSIETNDNEKIKKLIS